MSTFYKSLDYSTAREFKLRKQRFKKNQPCAICGRKLDSDEMMVAHKVPVRELTDYEALFDESNWEVRCLDCEHRLNREEDLQRKGHTIY